MLGATAWALWHSWRVGWLTEAHFAALGSCPDDVEASHRVEPADVPAVRLVTRAEGLQSPTSVAFHPTLVLYVSQQRGAVRAIRNGRLVDRPMVDLTGHPPHPRGRGPLRGPRGQPVGPVPPAAPEAWARGTRNPYRIDVDPETGDVWVADVGLRCAEEVTRIAGGRAGANLGWHYREGGLDFVGGGPTDLLDPVYWHPHGPGCAVIGGAVYRGRRLPELEGSYVVSDYCTGRLVALTPVGEGDDGGQVSARDLGVESLAPLGIFRAPDGELWLTNQSGEVLELGRAGAGAPTDG